MYSRQVLLVMLTEKKRKRQTPRYFIALTLDRVQCLLYYLTFTHNSNTIVFFHVAKTGHCHLHLLVLIPTQILLGYF